MQAEVISTASFSTNFPNKIENEIIKDNIIVTLKKQLNAPCDIIFLNGSNEIGKSTFLSQFAKTDLKHTITVFLKPVNQFTSNIDNAIYDLCKQLHWILFDNTEFENLNFNIEFLSQYFFKLIRKLKSSEIFYILLDGFEHLDAQYVNHLEFVLDNLPVGYQNIKVIISDKENRLQKLIPKLLSKVNFYVYPYSPFSLDDIEKYFKDRDISRHLTNYILKITEGIPSKLKHILDLSTTTSLEEVLNDANNYEDLLEMQWNTIDMEDSILIDLLSLTAHEKINYSMSKISDILNIEEEKLSEIVKTVSFIEVSNDDNSVSYISPTFKTFVKNKLRNKKDFVDQVIIKNYLKDSNSTDYLIELPKRYDNVKNFDALLNILSEDNFKKIVEIKESLLYIEEQTLIGIRAAEQLRRHPEHFKLALQRTSIQEVKHPYVWKAEIKVKIELKQFEKAFDLANHSILKEERFRMLVYLGKLLKIRDLEISNEILDGIKVLYSQINHYQYFNNEEIVEIASDLLYTFQDLAIELLENNKNDDIENSTDIGFARLALLLKNSSKGETAENDSIKNLLNRIKTPELKTYSSTFSKNIKVNCLEFINECSALTNSKERLKLARLFINENYKDLNISKVVYFALENLLISSTENVTSSNVLEDLSKPLPFIADHDIIKDLVNRFDTFIEISKKNGPTVAHLKFLLNLGSSLLNINFDEARNRFYEIYIDIQLIKDISIKTEAYASFYKTLVRIDNTRKLELSDNFETVCLADLKGTFTQLLNQTSQHFKICRDVIFEIGYVNPEEAFLMLKDVNTRSRRDQLYFTALSSYLRNDLLTLDFKVIDNCYKAIIDPKTKNDICVLVLSTFDDDKSETRHYTPLKKYIERIKDFYSNFNKGYTYSLALSIVNRLAKPDLPVLYLEIDEFWERLQDGFYKIDCGFNLSSTLIGFDKDKALQYHNKSEEEKKYLLLNSPTSLDLFYNSIRLAIRSFSGLIQAKSFTDEDLRLIFLTIKKYPNEIEQVRLSSMLLYRFWVQKDTNTLKNLYEEHLKPFILKILIPNDFSLDEILDILLEISPLIYNFQRDAFNELVTGKLSFYKDYCYDAIINFAIRKHIPGEAYDNDERSLKIDMDSALLVLSILEQMSTDSLITESINDLRKCSKNNSFVKEQLNHIDQKLTKIIEEKLPDSNNIKHNGFKLLSKAYQYALISEVNKQVWQKLIVEVHLIPNITDRAFILGIIATIIPNKLKDTYKAPLFKESVAYIEQIESYIERVHRYKDMAGHYKDINISDCKQILKNAMSDSIIEGNSELYSTQKDVIDLAYEIDSNLAEELIKIVDNDPARKPISEKLKKHMGTLTLTQNIFDDKEIKAKYDNKQFAKACLSILSKLNSNRIAAKSLDKTILWLAKAQDLPLSESYAIFLAFVENCNVWLNKTPTSTSLLRTFFDYSMRNIQMILTLSEKNNLMLRFDQSTIIPESENQNLIKPGDRDSSIEFIKAWIRNEVSNYIIICDPYFTSDDIYLIKDIFMINPEVKITILGEYEGTGETIRSAFVNAWDEICDQEPPETDVILVGYQNGTKTDKFISPTHDRWYTTFNSGLRVGTSYNSIGNKNSEISIMSSIESKKIENEILKKYITRTERYHNGNRLSYLQFNL